jgi:hypothetical protein
VGTGARLSPFPARCDDGLLLPFKAVSTKSVVKNAHILAVPGVIVKSIVRQIEPIYLKVQGGFFKKGLRVTLQVV